MAKTYPITPEQKRFLESFRCERLTADPANRDLIRYFRNRKGEGLVMQLQRFAWKEDQQGTTAYYVVKDRGGNIVLFFSLKCGVLFDPNEIKSHMDTYGGDDFGRKWDAILKPEEAAMPELQCIRSQDPEDVLLYLHTDADIESLELLQKTLGYRRAVEVQRQLIQDLELYKTTKYEKKIEPNKNIIRVPESFSAIELVEFCANEKTAKCWDEELMGGRSMGTTMFWHFIVPKMLQINQLIGSEYVFLFAADHSLRPYQQEIGKLIKLYQDLHFDYAPDLGTAKPFYDFSCQFMCQRLRTVGSELGMDTHLKDFFENFNEDPNAYDYT